jgi:glutaredoxin
VRAKSLLEARGLDYEQVSLDDGSQFRRRLHDETGGWTVPQIVVDDKPIGGFAELWRLDKLGLLTQLAA